MRSYNGPTWNNTVNWDRVDTLISAYRDETPPNVELYLEHLDWCSHCPEGPDMQPAQFTVEYVGRNTYPDVRDARRDLACQGCLGEAVAWAWAQYDRFSPPVVRPFDGSPLLEVAREFSDTRI